MSESQIVAIKGPWLIEDGDFVYALNENKINIFSCQVQGGYTNDGKRTSKEERAAIAKLIAAAPDMLKMLKLAYVLLDEGGYPKLQNMIERVVLQAETNA